MAGKSGSEESEKKAKKGAAGPGSELSSSQRLPMTIHSQYLKDLSFENPNAPLSLRPAKEGKPVMDINFSMDAQKVDSLGPDVPDLYEVTLGIQVRSKKDGMAAFIIDVEYGLLVALDEGVAADQAHKALLIEMPRYIFPYVRQIVSDLTQQGGYPPLLLAPVDFKGLYKKRFGSGAAAAAEDAA